MKKIGIFLLGMLLHVAALASELDLYKGEPVKVPAQIMLLVDTSTSMGDSLPGATGDCVSKMCILKATLKKYVDPDDTHPDTRWPDDFAVGLAVYDSPGAKILEPVTKLGSVGSDGVTYRQKLAETIKNLDAFGYTPLVGAYLDVLNYLKGRQVAFASTRDSSVDSVWVDPNSTPTRLFKTGMNSDLVCGVSDSHIVVLTDGGSNMEQTSRKTLSGNTMANEIKKFVTGNPDATDALDDCPEGVATNLFDTSLSNNPTKIYTCASELAKALADVDSAGEALGITTSVIAYNLGTESDANISSGDKATLEGLKNWALAGGGKFFTANATDELDNAFKDISSKVQGKDSFTGAVPGVGINQSNRFTFLDDIYFSVFKPSGSRFWYGNLKKYKIGWQDNAPVILDSKDHNIDGGTGAPAPKDGFIDADAVSFWFNPDDYSLTTPVQADGNNVFLGGAAMRIPNKDSRRLYTTINGDTQLFSDATISDIRSEMEPSTPATPTTAETTKINVVLDWLQGEDADVNNEWNRELYDPVTKQVSVVKKDDLKNVRTMYGSSIHSGPVVVNYISTKVASDGSRQLLPPDQQSNLVFVSTNDGKLYAVDSATGDEKLAFMPEYFLKRPSDSTPSLVETMYDAARTNEQGDLIYGLDSSWTVWRQDVNHDGNITSSGSNDFVYLYGGMRRGGSNYYALNMTGADDTTPTMSQMFELKGGQGDFQNMGQTWSRPVLGMIKYKGEPVVVMIVGGGYDPVYDTGRPASGTLPKGAQLYIVAARDRGGDNSIHKGQVLWWASASGSTSGNHAYISALTQSIPSTVKVLDTNGDGYLDHIYVGDLGGQLLRFDIDNDNNTVTGTGTGEKPLISNIDNVVVAQLGMAGNPGASAADDRRFFYPPSIAMMKDNNGKYVGIAIGSGNIVNPKGTDINERFYFIKDYKALGGSQDTSVFHQNLTLQSEKLLGSPLIVQGTAYFTTYYWDPNAQTTVDASECHAAYGRSALYTYTPGDSAVKLIEKNRPQNLATDIVTLLQRLPDVRAKDGTLISPGPLKLTGLTGPGAINLPDVDFGNIRKTLWKQCQTAACP